MVYEFMLFVFILMGFYLFFVSNCLIYVKILKNYCGLMLDNVLELL